MASVNQTRSHCVNQTGKTHSKPLAARHGMGAASARRAMCESAFSVMKQMSLACLTKSTNVLLTLAIPMCYLIHVQYKISVKTQQFITLNTILGRLVSTLLSHLHALQKTDPSLSTFMVHSGIPNA